MLKRVPGGDSRIIGEEGRGVRRSLFIRKQVARGTGVYGKGETNKLRDQILGLRSEQNLPNSYKLSTRERKSKDEDKNGFLGKHTEILGVRENNRARVGA